MSSSQDVGNAAAMREALKVANETADELLKWIWNHYQELNCMGSRLKRAVEAALSAPPRNCDRFSDEFDAQLAFLNEVWLISIDRETMTEQDAYENWTDEMRARYGRWLLAPRRSRKGNPMEANNKSVREALIDTSSGRHSAHQASNL